VTSGAKTITIRDVTESHYQPGSVVRVCVYPLENADEYTCSIRIENVEPISFDDLNETHAQQESLPLDELLAILRDIYPDTNELFVISFRLLQ
jgi:uncharacterized protein YqfB (UPF0267 family)